MTKKRLLLIIPIFIVIFIALGILNRRNQRNNATTTQTGDSVTAFIGDLSANASASGEIVPARTADLAFTSSGDVANIFVTSGDTVQAGDPLIQLDTTDLQRAVASAEQDVASQTANLAALQTGASTADIAAAQAAVASAQAALDNTLAGPTAEAIASLQANVDAAQANVWAAQANLNQALSGASDAEILAAQADLDAAQENQTNAQTNYDQTWACFTEPDGQ